MKLKYNIIESLIDQHVADGNENKIAVIGCNTKYTYNDLYVISSNLANTYSDLKVKEGSIVLCLFEDPMLIIFAYLALLRVNLVPCILNPYFTAHELDQCICKSDAKFALLETGKVEKIKPYLDKRGISFNILTYNIIEQNTKKVSHNTLLGSSNRPAFCLFTSGTTGYPLAVIHRHCDILNTNTLYAKNILNIKKSDIIYTTSKLYYAYGLNSLNYALFNGATYIIPPIAVVAKLIWERICEFKATIFFSVPTVLSKLLYEDIDNTKLNLRLTISAGEHLPIQVYRKWKERVSSKILDGIGTTEVLSTFISNTPTDIYEGSLGKIVPGFEIKIKRKDGTEADINEPGVLWVKGDTFIDKYLNDEKATSNRFENGWFKTNDVFTVDKNGYFFYYGRASEVVKVGGVWILPKRIEEILNSHVDVKESAVIIKKDNNGLPRTYAYVSLINDTNNYSQELIKQLKDLCKQNCSKYEYPHFIYFISKLPRTETGKVKKYQLANQGDGIL